MFIRLNLQLWAFVVIFSIAIISPLFSADAIFPFKDKNTIISMKRFISKSGERYLFSEIVPVEDNVFEKESEKEMKVIGFLGGMTCPTHPPTDPSANPHE